MTAARERELEAMVKTLEDEVKQLRYDSTHDPLTGLLNRRAAIAQMRVWLTGAARVGVLAIDLDDFFELNNSRGHVAGDHALEQVARMLEARTPRDGIAVRMGGDEFMVAWPGCSGEVEARSVGEKVFHRLTDGALILRGKLYELSVSIGVAYSGQPVPLNAADEELMTLWDQADAAMYDAKVQPMPPKVRTYNPKGRDSRWVRQRYKVIKPYIDRGQFTAALMPIHDLASGELVMYEALFRPTQPGWKEDYGRDDLLIMEQTGLIQSVDLGVLREALQRREVWSEEVSLAVNVSMVSLREPKFASSFLGVLADAHYPASRVVAELTETSPEGRRSATVRNISQLAKAGVRLVLDDMGEGFSQPERLERFGPYLSGIKASMSCWRDSSEDSYTVLSSLAELAIPSGGGFTMTIEGVAKPWHIDVLARLQDFLPQLQLLGQGEFFQVDDD